MHGGNHRASACAYASAAQIQQMLSKAVNARLPLMLAGRPLPGHGDDQVGTGHYTQLARKDLYRLMVATYSN